MKKLKTLIPQIIELFALFFVVSCQEAIQNADIIVYNANIWTGNEQQLHASAMAIAGDSIISIGLDTDVQKFKGSATEMLNMKGKLIVPGFIDTHVHMLMGGNSLLNVQLRDAKSPEEFTKRIGEFAKTIPPGTWIVEGNWDHTLWGGDLPKKEWIDEVSRENPVAVYRLDGHMVLANSAALAFAGIDKNTLDVSNGEIVRDKDGEPTGILKSNAMNLLLDKIPPLSTKQKKAATLAAQDYFMSNGVTSVHDVDSLGGYAIAKKLRDSNELSIRIYSAKPLNRWDEVLKMTKANDNFLKAGLVKGFVDGSLGSHTAAFKEPYSDKGDDKGFFINSPENLYTWISDADKSNLHITVHAIGDKAIHTLLDIYDRITKENGTKDRRLRIEHAQHISPEDIERFADLGVIASMQPYHAIDDGRWAEELIGPERIKTTYAFKSFLDAGTTLSFGSDWPVAPASPLQGIYAAVTRQTLDGANPKGWVPKQKITVEQALLAYTKNAAYASFEDRIKGTLEPGKLADFVVLSEDITKVNPKKINEVSVLETFIGGKKVFDIDEN